MTDLNKPTGKTIVIIGGVAGGMSTAARLRRLDETAEIIIFERSGFVSFANCGLPYYLGKEIEDRSDLILQTPESLSSRFNLKVKVQHEVIQIDPTEKKITVKNLQTHETFTQKYDELVLSVGAKPIKPELKGINLPGIFSIRTLEDTDEIESWIINNQPQNVVVCGGGFIGLEVAEQLKHRGLNVSLIDSGNQVIKPLDPEMASLLEAEIKQKNVNLYLNAKLEEVALENPENKSHHPLVGWVKTSDGNLIAADLIILGLGVRPETTLAKQAGIELGESGGIKVNELLQTNIQNIWAVGDAIEVVHPISKLKTLISLGGPANRQGRIVANNIMGQTDKYKGTIGTAIIRVFSLTAASTGLNEGQLKKLGLPYEALYLHPNQHAGYYPGAKKIALKLLFNPFTEEIYGAQAVGEDGVDKRIDIIATAILGHLKVSDLAELELCYAPPFGSAKDPINLAGMMAENIMDGLVEQVQWHQLDTLNTKTHFLVDVREPSELTQGLIEGSLNIPLGQLRNNFDKLPKDKTIIVYCQSGQRSYFASRVLALNGFKVKNLSGAYLTAKNSLPAVKQNA